MFPAPFSNISPIRMYWCKRLLEWSPCPREALRRALLLNNKWQLDGRDENGYMGVAWCFGQHDRPFPERPVFGSVRSMSPSGLEAKFDMGRYRRLVAAQCARAARRDPRLCGLLPKEALTGAREQQQRSIVSFLGTKRPLQSPPRSGAPSDGCSASFGTAEEEEEACQGGAVSDSMKTVERLKPSGSEPGQPKKDSSDRDREATHDYHTENHMRE